ncbi:MAG TPA: hypothetical protein PKL30_09470 [Leptospiraceae bacterium]|nr:hypothetical protein [Leptospiraceae bacterium]HMX32084.1 hypothetical protein [Leptospiraceae bacterium]HMY32338.1 hypothetical protein [Leptospiraceae bacterium]HMZ62460.1 hypothetical protein [Leptospiraceae bacterium]HNC01300.1 hypothetical protein [Leptospiraceae bacterium]
MRNYIKLFFQIIFLLFFPNSVFSDPYYFINVPYGVFTTSFNSNNNGSKSTEMTESFFIPSFSRVEIRETKKDETNLFSYDSALKIRYNNKIGFLPKSYIGTYNVINKKESPDRSKYFEIISPYKNCDCNRYTGYIDSCFMEIRSKNSKLIQRIGNDKQKACRNHYWTRVKDWFNENDLLMDGYGDGDAGSGGTWSFAKEKVNWSTGKINELYTVNQLNCKDSEAKDGYSILFQVESSKNFYILWKEKLYRVDAPIIRFGSFKFKLMEEMDAYDCKIDFKKMKPIQESSITIYKEGKNSISYNNQGEFNFFYNGKEISQH